MNPPGGKLIVFRFINSRAELCFVFFLIKHLFYIVFNA